MRTKNKDNKINNENNEKHYLFMKYTIFQPKNPLFFA